MIEASNAEGDSDFEDARHRVLGVISSFDTSIMDVSDFSEEWLDGRVRVLRKHYPTETLTPQERSLFINEFRNNFAHVQGLFGQVFDTVDGALKKLRRALDEGGAVDSSSDISNPSDPTGIGYPLSADVSKADRRASSWTHLLAFFVNRPLAAAAAIPPRGAVPESVMVTTPSVAATGPAAIDTSRPGAESEAKDDKDDAGRGRGKRGVDEVDASDTKMRAEQKPSKKKK